MPAKLSPAKQALLAQRLKGKAAPRITIPKRDSNVPIPLSFAQQRLWFLTQLEPDNPFYNNPTALRLEGDLDISAFQQAVDQLVQRHETLRTTFTTIDEQPQQIIHPQVAIPIEQVDLSALPSNKKDQEVERVAIATATQPFDLSQGPLLRIKLLRLSPSQSVLLVTLHHIIFDAWSTGIFIRELAYFYRKALQSEPVNLPELPIQYADFSHWQRQQTDRLEQQLHYWQQQFATLPPVLALPTDRPRPAVQTYRGDRCTIELSKVLTQNLKQLAQDTDSTLFMVLLASFQVLLHRYTHQTDITVGTPIANRNQTAIEGLIGFFINSLAMRADLSGNPTFKQLLVQVRERTLGAYAHQDLPFEKLVDALDMPRDLSYSPLFQVMLILQNAPTTALDIPGLTLTPLHYNAQITKLDLTLMCIEQDDGLTAVMEFNTDLFDAVTIERMMAHWQTLLQGLITAPNTPIDTLPLWSTTLPPELDQWNQTKQDVPPQLIHQLFEAQADHTPTGIALICQPDSLTYQDLNHKANQLARYLKAQGIGPETFVGIYLHRSPELLIALLAVLKAGGTYIPLDPTYPTSRLAYMVADSGLQLVLTHRPLPPLTPNIPCLDLEGDAHLWAAASEQNLSSEFLADQLAYVIYTSGSTGQPKGVQITHHAVVNFLIHHQKALQISAVDRLLAVTSVSFDIAVLELFLPLIVGAQVILVDRDEATDGYQLAQRLTEATLMQATPSTWRLLLATNWSGQSNLQILSGGEALPPDLAALLLPKCQTLWNMYGPTETTIWSSHAQITAATGITIGQPIANTEIYVLDRHLNPVPIGVVGELYIGGIGLARGYLNRPRLTADRFIPHPFGTVPGARLYRTGDLARYRPDGTLQHLGRADHQLKVRGVRIELSEIEFHLHQHPQVQTAVVVAQGPDNQLVAYCVPLANQSLTPESLRQFLQQHLPLAMVPTLYVSLSELPLTPNGKIDRRALPAPTTEVITRGQPFVAPWSTTEQALADIWAQILGIAEIGIDDNFFDLGGDSIRSLQVVSRAYAAQISLTPKDIFQHQTIRALAHAVTEQPSSEIPLPLNQPSPQQQQILQRSIDHELEDIYPLAPMQQGMLFHTLYHAQGLYVAQFCYRLQGPLNIPALQQAWQTVIQHYPALRTAFGWEGLDSPLQWVAAEVALPWENLDWRRESAVWQRIDDFLYQDRVRGFPVHQPPLMRLTLIQLQDSAFEFIWSVHHLILDGWSLSLVLQNVFQQYAALEQGQVSPLPPAAPYRNYIAWQQQQSAVAAKQFWQDYLQAFTHLQPLGTVGKTPAIGNRADRQQGYIHLRHPLSASLTSVLQQHCHDHRLTLNSLIQGAWALVLSQIIQTRDVVFGATTAGRPPQLPNAEQMVGVFINTLPVRVQIDPDSELMSWLQTLQEQQITARQFEYSPLTDIHQASDVPQETALFDNIVVFENYPVDLAAIETLQTAVKIKEFRSFVNNSYPLTVRAIPGEVLSLEMMADLVCLQQSHVECWLQLLAHTLESMAVAPSLTVGEQLTNLATHQLKLQSQQAETLKTSSLGKLKRSQRKTVISQSQEGSS